MRAQFVFCFFNIHQYLSLPFEGAAFLWNLAKLITLSGSLCMLCHPIPELSPVSLFSLSRLKAQLCALLAHSLVVYLAPSSGTDCHGRLTDSCTVGFLLPSSQPTACLQLPACLEQISTHRGLSILHYFSHKVTGNQWSKFFFFFLLK